MNDNDNLKSLYSTLINEGYEPPKYDQFVKDMQDEQNLQGVYNTLINEGYEPPKFDQFKQDMGWQSPQGGQSLWNKVSQGMSNQMSALNGTTDYGNGEVPEGYTAGTTTEEEVESSGTPMTGDELRAYNRKQGAFNPKDAKGTEGGVTPQQVTEAGTAVGNVGGATQGAQGAGTLSGQQEQQNMTDEQFYDLLGQDTEEGRQARRDTYELLKSQGRDVPKTFDEFDRMVLDELKGGASNESHPINPHPKEEAQRQREMTDAEYNAFVNNLKADDENGRKARLSFYEMLQKKGEKNLPSTFDEFEKALMAEFAAEEASKGKNPAMVSPIQDEQGYSGWNLLSEVPAYASAPSEGNYMMIPTKEELDKQRQLREGFMLNDALEHVVAQQERFEREGIAGNAEPIKGIAVPPQKTNRMSEAARSGSTRLMNGQMANNGELEDRMTEYYRNIVETYVAAANGDAKALETAMQWNQKNALDLLRLEGYGLNIDEQPDENGVYRKTKGFMNQAVLNVIIPRAEAMAAYVLNGLGNPPMNIASRLRRIYYDRAIQQSLKDEIHYSGIDYQWYVENIMFPAMRRVSKQKYGYDVMKYSDVLFVKPDDVREQMEVGEADALNRKYVSDGLDKVFADMDKRAMETFKERWDEKDFWDRLNPFYDINTAKKVNEAFDYEEALKGVMGDSVKYFVDMVHDPRYLKEAQALADRAGVDLSTYVMDYALNGFMDSLQGKFMEMAVLKEMPRDKWSYVWGGIEESILGMVGSAMTRSESQRKVRSEALAMTEMGENPYFDNETPGMGWRGMRLATNMIADAWLWYGAGKLGGAMAKRWMTRRLESLMLEHGCSVAQAERLLFAEGEKYLGKQMADKAIQGALSMSTTLGTATAATETTRGITSGENVGTAIWQGLTAGGKEYLKGLVLGAFIGTGGTLTRNLKGAAKVAGKTAAFAGEGLSFYTLGEFEKSLNGEDSFQNFGEGWVDSMVNLLFIKASGNPQEFFPSLFRTIRSPKRAYKTSGAENEKARRAQAGIDDIHLTSDDIKWLKSEYGGKTFLDALEALRPSDKDYAYQGVEGRERQAPVNREKARKAAEEYAKLMSNPDIPADRKQRIANALQGVAPVVGLKCDAEIIERDGKFVVRTRDYDGMCVTEDEFKSRDKAEQSVAEQSKRFEQNRVRSKQQRVGDIDMDDNFESYMEEQSNAALKKVREGKDLNADEQRLLRIRGQYPHILELLAKGDKGETLTEDEQKLLREYGSLYQEYAMSGDSIMRFTDRYEAAHGLQQGTVNEAVNVREDRRTPEQRRIVNEYKMAIDAYLSECERGDRKPKTAEERIALAKEASISGEDGVIRPAVMADDEGTDVFIINGKVVMNEDGTAVDKDKSDKDIIVRYNDGTAVMVDISEISKLQEPRKAEKKPAAAEGDETYGTAKKTEDKQSDDNSEGVDVVAGEDKVDIGQAQGQAPVQGEEVGAPGQPVAGETPNGTEGAPEGGAKRNVYTVKDGKGGTKEIEVLPSEDEGLVKIRDGEKVYYRTKEQFNDMLAEGTPETATETPAAPEMPITPESSVNDNTPPAAVSDMDAPMPMMEVDGKSKPDYDKVTPQRARKYLYDELGLSKEEADNFAEKYRDRAAKELEELKSQEPRMDDYDDAEDYAAAKKDWEEKIKDAERRRDYWEEVRNPKEEAKEETAAPVEEKTEEVQPVAEQPIKEPTQDEKVEQPQEEKVEQSVETPKTEEKAEEQKTEESATEEEKNENYNVAPEGEKEEEEKTAATETRHERLARRRKVVQTAMRKAYEWSMKTGTRIKVITDVEDIDDDKVYNDIKGIDPRTGLNVVKKIDPETGKEVEIPIKPVRVRGWYDSKTDTVYLFTPHIKDMEAVEHVILHETVAHHGLRKLLDKDFDTLCDKVFEDMSEADKKEYLGYYDRSSFSSDEEHRRAAADEYMAEIAEKADLDTSRWSRIASRIRVALRKRGFTKVTLNDKDIANLLRRSKRNLEKKRLNELTEGTITDMSDVAANDGRASLRYNYATEDDVEQKLMNFSKSEEGKEAGWTPEKMEDVIENTRALIDMIDKTLKGDKRYDEWRDRKPTIIMDWRDGEYKPTVTWSRNNVEYKYDMSADLLCVNNEAMEDVLNSPIMISLITEAMTGADRKGNVHMRDFDSKDYARLYETMRDLAFVVPCKGCFDFAARLKMLPSVSQNFAKVVAEVVAKRNEDPDAFDEALKERAAESGKATVNGLPSTSRTKLNAIEVAVAGDNITEAIPWRDFMTAEGQTRMLEKYPGLFRAWQRTGAGRPKDKLLPEPWSGEIADPSFGTIIAPYGDKTPSFRAEEVNVGTGLRRNSHSEFRPTLIIDEIQFLREAFIKNLTVFKYMKELDDVRVGGKLGVKYNMSFFPAFDKNGRAAGLDANGDYIAAEESVGAREFAYIGEDGKTHYDGMKGRDEALKYVNENVSMSAVAFSIPHMIKLFTDVPTHIDKRGWVGSVIPCHASGATAEQLAAQGLGKVRAISPEASSGSFMREAMTDYDKGVTNFEQVQNDRFGEGWVVKEGTDKGKALPAGHKLEFVNGTHYYNEKLGIHLFKNGYAYDSELPGGKVTKEIKSNPPHPLTIDYNDKVREIGTDYAYKDAADFYVNTMREIGLIPRFDFTVPEDVFLKMCSDANVDPRDPKLGWKGEGNGWSPVDSDAYYSVWCDYGMTDPETGKWSPHRPVGIINEKGEREFRLPDNIVDVAREGLERYSNRRDVEEGRTNEAVIGFVERSIEDGAMSEEKAREILRDNGIDDSVLFKKKQGGRRYSVSKDDVDYSGLHDERDDVRTGRNGIRYSIGGERGAESNETAKRNLETAREMESKGKDAKAIWLATGWEKGADGKWRYEMPDAEPKGVNIDGVGNKAVPLSELVNAPELFEAYPQLKGFKVKFKRMSSAGSYSPLTNTLSLDRDANTDYDIPKDVLKEINQKVYDFIYSGACRTMKDMNRYRDELMRNAGSRMLNKFGLETVLHEVQHAIQGIEGFAQGGNSDTMKLERYDKERGTDPDMAIFARTIAETNTSGKLIAAGKDAVVEALTKNLLPQCTGEQAKEVESLIIRLRDMSNSDYAKFVYKAKDMATEAKKEGERLYKNIAGEVEARNVEKRNGMTEEERRSTPLSETEDVDRGEQIVRYSVDKEERKKKQFDIIQENNPHNDELGNHTWIRSADDIKTYDEALKEDGVIDYTPDYTADMVEDAAKSGSVVVYSSKPIKDGIFVTPSRMEAQNYAGDGKVYSSKVALDDVAWIDPLQGQYAKVENAPVGGAVSNGVRFSEWEDNESAPRERSGAVSGGSSSEGLLNGSSAHLSRSPQASQKDAAKIKSNTEIAKNSAKKIINAGGLKGKIDTPAKAVREIGNGLHLEKSKSSSSYYSDFYEGDFEIDGNTVHVRVSTHPANGERIGNAQADDKVSIVIRKNGEHVSTGEHKGYTEYVYEPSEVSPENAANAIVKGIKSLIEKGVFEDETGLAHRRDYPYEENGKIVYSISKDEDSAYMSAVEKGDDKTAERMVKEAAKNGGMATDSEGRVVDLYHGTDKYGFTVFDLLRARAGSIFTSTKAIVSANYGGDNNYAGVRRINKGYKESNTTEGIIDNARSVLNQDWKLATEEQKNAIIEKTEGDARKIAEEIDNLARNAGELPQDEEIDIFNATAWVSDLFYTVGYGRENGNDGQGLYRLVTEGVERYQSNKQAIRDYISKHYDELSDADKAYLNFLTHWKSGDVAIDISCSYKEALSGKELATVTGDSLISVDHLKESVDKIHNIGSYHLYGNIGDNPLIVDAEGKNWYSLEYDGKRYDADTLAEYAKKNGYTSLVIKNVYDYGDMADDYIFFSPNQIKSADPVTYDDAGKPIPLSERFNQEKKDIRYSVDGEDETTDGMREDDMFGGDEEMTDENGIDEARRAIDEEAGDDWNTHEAVSFRNALMTLADKNKDDLEKRDNSLNKNIEYLTELRKQLLTQKEYDDKAGVAVRRSAAVQRKYDRRVAEDIVRFAKALMEHQAVDNMTLYQTSRLISMMRDAAGGKDIVGQARKVVDLMLNQQLRGLKSVLARQMRIKGTKVSGKGVEVQGKLDVRGANMVRAMKGAMGLSEQALNERIADCEERMGSNDELIRKEAEAEYDGLSLARQYQEEIKSREEDAAAIREQMRQEMNRFRPNNDGLKGEDRKRAYAEHEELMQSYQDALFENMEEQAAAYRNLLSNLGVGIQSGIKRAEEFRNKERQRVDDIRHDANSDLEGVSAEAHRDLSLRQKANNWVIFRPFMKPMATFDYMLRFFGGKNATGEGYLFRRFMGDWTDASNKHWRGLQESYSELDSKAREIFGNEVKRWSDLFELERHMKGMKVEFTDDGERMEHELTQGNMLYIYMVNKMTDGKMKLRKMGITEEDVAKIKEELDPRFVELADWMQNDYLVKKRTKYNEVHERMFGASMAAIENYFPLKINDRSRHQEIDSNSKDSGDELPSTITNAVIKRKRNSLDLDITHADAFDVMLEHIENMEHWAAFAEFNRDTSTLLSYGKFRNKVMNMSSLRYGAGERLFNNFKDCCAIAGGVYNPKVDIDSIDKQIVNLAKGVTMAKINLRAYTAFKQLTSYPAYFSEANPLELAKAWNVPSTWDWAIENLPGFAERWQSRQAGDTRLREADTDWGIWRKGFVAKASRFGMTPNAAIDALTVATGAKAVYETKKARYLKDGYSEEQADRKALLDASFAYNETQQSSANAFVSAMQLNRTVASTALTVFRNASMGYNRRYAQAWNNLARRAKKGYKEQSIEFMAKQMERDGLSPEQARTVAERVYKRTLWHSLADIAIFGHVLQTAWNLAPYLPYLLAGDDSEEKNKMLTDALMHSLAGPIEGLSAGAQISEMYNLIRSGEGLKNYKFNLLPLMSDLQNIYNRFEKDGAAGINNIVNLGIQIGFGVNPQTLTDFAVATYDWFGGDPAITNEWAMWLMRVLQFPSSATENLYLDEIGMYADDAKKLSIDELAERYAKYKILKGAPLTFWTYSDEKEGDLMKSKVKQFEEKVKERLEYLTDDELMNFSSDDPALKELADKVYGKRVEETVADMSEFDMSNEFKDADPKKKREISKRYAKDRGVSDERGEKKKNPAQQLYQRLRDFADMADDTLFEVEQAKAKADGDEDREEDISNAKKDITAEINYQLGDIDVNDEREIARAMNEIRKCKKEWLKDLKIK